MPLIPATVCGDQGWGSRQQVGHHPGACCRSNPFVIMPIMASADGPDRPGFSSPRCDPSAVAAVIHATSDQALRQPEQSDETSRHDQQRHGSSCESGVKTYSAQGQAILGQMASRGIR